MHHKSIWPHEVKLIPIAQCFVGYVDSKWHKHIPESVEPGHEKLDIYILLSNQIGDAEVSSKFVLLLQQYLHNVRTKTKLR